MLPIQTDVHDLCHVQTVESVMVYGAAWRLVYYIIVSHHYYPTSCNQPTLRDTTVILSSLADVSGCSVLSAPPPPTTVLVKDWLPCIALVQVVESKRPLRYAGGRLASVHST